MTPFQITFHYLNNERKIENLEKSFSDVKNQLDLYEKQHSNTIKSYLKSRKEELDTLRERYAKTEKEAQKRYEEALGTENPDDQDNIAYATHISGIDYIIHNKSEEMEKIKIKYSDFLDLFSKSTLIALYSLNENFLNKVCDFASETFEQKIKVSHFNSRNYLKASFDYLELVINIQKKPFESYISKLKDIQSIRNRIIHAGSQITDTSILKLVKKHSHSFHYNEENQFLRIISPKYTEDFFNILRNLYEELFWQLEERQNWNTLKNILENWFGLIEGEISILNLKASKTSNKIRTIQFNIKSSNSKIPRLNGKLTLTRSKGYIREIIDQTENDLILEFVEAEKDGVHLEMELKTFMAFDKSLDIGVKIY